MAWRKSFPTYAKGKSCIEGRVGDKCLEFIESNGKPIYTPINLVFVEI